MGATAMGVRDRLEHDSYVIVEDIFDPDVDLVPLYDQWSAVLHEVAAALMAKGLLTSTFDELPFEERLIAVTEQSGQNVSKYFDISLPQRNISGDTPICATPAMFRLLTNERLLDVVEEVIGPEITSNPTQHVRMKLPGRSLADPHDGLSAGVPFHQDQGVLLPEADESDILTCWVAITDADESNGCLQVFPQSDRAGLVQHCPGDSAAMVGPGQVGIPPRLLPGTDAKALPMRAGSALFFNRRLVHGSCDNTTTDKVRISLDLRYQPTGQPTGRPVFPAFVARSREDPGSVLRDAGKWRDLWYGARDRLAHDATPRFNRWGTDSPVCA
ncbi:MAG TPA: phytanoyl-CoA dioxygenase family protein [Acidimicrobiales bacterium]|nr:phytanoyl-CoA dioxygenase family protein [Acidimicrobiales bacterium]